MNQARVDYVVNLMRRRRVSGGLAARPRLQDGDARSPANIPGNPDVRRDSGMSYRSRLNDAVAHCLARETDR